jgi:hypothetical protein
MQDDLKNKIEAHLEECNQLRSDFDAFGVALEVFGSDLHTFGAGLEASRTEFEAVGIVLPAPRSQRPCA